MARRFLMAASCVHDQLSTNHSAICAFMVLLLAGIAPASAGDSYDLAFSTYFGGNGTENADGVYVDSRGNVMVTGDTHSIDLPVTTDACQAQNHGGGEAFVVLLSANFSGLLYSTYLGGPSNDNGRSGFLGSDGSLYVTGSSDGPGDWGAGDNILAKLTPRGVIPAHSSAK